MFRAIALLLNPAGTWERIALAQRGVYFILFVHLAPLLALTLGVEAYGLVRLGESRRMLSEAPATLRAVAPDVAVRYAAAAAVLYTAAILLSARVAQTLGNSFQSTHNYRQALATVAYGLSPYFLCRMLDGLPGVNTWFAFGLGVLLTIPAFYHGVPQVMKPDPARAFGLFLSIQVFCGMGMGIVHFLAVSVLHEELVPAAARFLQRFTGA